MLDTPEFIRLILFLLGSKIIYVHCSTAPLSTVVLFLILFGSTLSASVRLLSLKS